jgi:tetrahydromethanopterin S-methyltransferase subunit H
VPEELCEEQSVLAQAVVGAVAKVNAAKRNLETIKESKVDAAPFIIALHNARAAGRRAVAALENHKKEHGCLSIADA